MKNERRFFCDFIITGILFYAVYVPPHVASYFREIGFDAGSVFPVDDAKQLFKFVAYLCHLFAGIGVEEDFLQQIVVFVEHPFGYLHVPLERGAGRILMLHHGGEHECAHERDAQRVGHGAVVLIEGVLVNVQVEPAVQVFEEDAPHVVSLTYDYRVLLAQLLQVGECRAKHRVCRHERMAALLIVLVQSCFYGRYVADDALGRQVGHDLFKRRYGVFQCHGVDDKLGAEVAHLAERCHSPAVVGEPHPFRIFVVHGRLVVETEQVEEEASHLTRSQYQYSHLLMISSCCFTDSSCMFSNTFATKSAPMPHSVP